MPLKDIIIKEVLLNMVMDLLKVGFQENQKEVGVEKLKGINTVNLSNTEK